MIPAEPTASRRHFLLGLCQLVPTSVAMTNTSEHEGIDWQVWWMMLQLSANILQTLHGQCLLFLCLWFWAPSLLQVPFCHHCCFNNILVHLVTQHFIFCTQVRDCEVNWPHVREVIHEETITLMYIVLDSICPALWRPFPCPDNWAQFLFCPFDNRDLNKQIKLCILI